MANEAVPHGTQSGSVRAFQHLSDAALQRITERTSVSNLQPVARRSLVEDFRQRLKMLVQSEIGDLSEVAPLTCPATSSDVALAVYLLKYIVRGWSRQVDEIIGRLNRDSSDIASAFDIHASVSSLKALTTGLSDRHNGGRTVARLEFADGQSFIYKPRDVRPEVTWQRIVLWVNTTCALPALTAPRALSRGSYGWCENINSSPPSSQRAFELHDERMGYLIAVAYFLGMTDMHADNIIVREDQPIIVDAETLFSPPFPNLGDFTGRRPGSRYSAYLNDSVLRTGFITNLTRSGFKRSKPRFFSSNRPGALIDSFRAMYDAICRHSDHLYGLPHKCS